MSKELSPTMLKAVDLANTNGGVLHRHPGGFWTPSATYTLSGGYAGTLTVEALVTRGAAEYAEWKEGRNGRFPVQMKLTAQPAQS